MSFHEIKFLTYSDLLHKSGDTTIKANKNLKKRKKSIRFFPVLGGIVDLESRPPVKTEIF